MGRGIVRNWGGGKDGRKWVDHNFRRNDDCRYIELGVVVGLISWDIVASYDSHERRMLSCGDQSEYYTERYLYCRSCMIADIQGHDGG